MFIIIRMVSLATFCLTVCAAPVCATNTQNVQRFTLPYSNCFKTTGARVTFERRTVWKVVAIDDIDTTELTHSNFQPVTQFKSIENLSFVSLHTNISVSILSQLKMFPQLKRLSLYGVGFDDEIACLKQIGSLTNLNELVLSYQHLSDAVLKELAGLMNLQVLNLGNHNCKSNCLESIIVLKNLRKIILSTTSLKSKDIMLLRELPYLQNLSIGFIDNVEPHNSLIDLSSLTNLVVLETNISCDEKALEVRTPKNLRILNVSLFSENEHNIILPEWIRHVRCLNIKSLMYGNALTRNDFETLNSLTNLNELSVNLGFRDKQTEQECMRILSHMRVPALKLDFYCTNASIDEWTKNIAENKYVQELELDGAVTENGYKSDGLKHIARLNQLKRLRIESSEINDCPDISEWRNLEKLRSLSLDISNLSDAQMSFLPYLKQLKSIELGRISSYLQGMDQIEDVRVYTFVTDKGLEMLSKLKKLRRLDLIGSTGYTDAGLAKLMDESPSLQTVIRSYWPEKKGE